MARQRPGARQRAEDARRSQDRSMYEEAGGVYRGKAKSKAKPSSSPRPKAPPKPGTADFGARSRQRVEKAWANMTDAQKARFKGTKTEKAGRKSK